MVWELCLLGLILGVGLGYMGWVRFGGFRTVGFGVFG